MTNAELIATLLCMPYHEPVEIEMDDGARVEIVGIDRIGWGIKLETACAVVDGDELQSELDDICKAIGEKVQQITEVLDELSETYGDQ